MANEELYKRLEEAGAVDLRNNREVIDVGGGYSKIVPINCSKLFKRKGGDRHGEDKKTIQLR